MKRKRKLSGVDNQASKELPSSHKRPGNPRVPYPVKLQEGASPAQVYPSVGNLGERCLGGHWGEECLQKCELSETKVTSTKWEYIERRKCYGNDSSKVTRWVCRGKNGRWTTHTISTSAKSADSGLTAGKIRKSFGDLHNLLEQNTETG